MQHLHINTCSQTSSSGRDWRFIWASLGNEEEDEDFHYLGHLTWVKLQQVTIRAALYPVLPCLCALFWCVLIVMQWAVAIHSAEPRQPETRPLLFFDFQLPKDLLRARQEPHRFDMVFVLIQGTRPSVRWTRQTRRQLHFYSTALSKGGGRIEPWAPALCRTMADECQGEKPPGHFCPLIVPC